MRSNTFSINGAKITVRTEDGNAHIDRTTAAIGLGIYDIHEKDDPDNGIQAGEYILPRRIAMRRQQFAAVWAQSEIEGDLGFEWPDNPLDKAAMSAACEAWLSLPGDTVGQWINEVNMINLSPNDPDLKPPEEVEKKD